MPNLMSNVDVGSMALMRKLGFLSHCSQIRVKLCDRVNVTVIRDLLTVQYLL